MSTEERAPKRVKLLDHASSESEIGESSDSASQANGLKINEEYAKRFEHNKKREERQQLEEKYGKNSQARDGEDDDDEEEEDSSEAESEDDDAEFATEDVDHEIMATLNALRSKDPRVYDKSVKFYKDLNVAENGTAKPKEEKPMYLQEYHRRKLMSGAQGDEEEDDSPPIQTYQDEQDQLRRELVGSMHATTAGEEDNSSGTEDGGFLVAKSKSKHEDLPKTDTVKITERDVADAEKDPETYLSNFMAARAWLPTEGSRWQAFDSDDSGDEDKADAFEEAYNMRFEDPAKANETLRSFARDVGKYSVRRDEKNSRKRARERENEKKEIEKRERGDERARLRKLKIGEAEEKLQKIKEAAGMRGKNVELEDWRAVIEGDFDDDTWEAEMERRFGEEYYADEDVSAPNDEDDADANGARKRIKKPRWDDEIDINDIVPEFDNEDDKPQFTLSDDEITEVGDVADTFVSDDEEDSRKKSKSKKERMQEKADAKRAARLERRRLEEMVDSALPLDHPSLGPISTTSNAGVTGFRYRETSPTNFGLSARDILFADDAQLNQFAGLKKLATFREDDKKRRDKKKFSKKARLRQWRKETFGDAEAPTGGFERLLGRQQNHTGSFHESRGADVNMVDGERKKKRRSRKGKSAQTLPPT